MNKVEVYRLEGFRSVNGALTKKVERTFVERPPRPEPEPIQHGEPRVVFIEVESSEVYTHRYTVGPGGIGAFKVVWIDNEGVVHEADCRNEAHFGRVIGMTLEARPAGELVRVQNRGYINNPDWDLEMNRYALGLNGELASAFSADARYIQEIGFTLDRHTLSLSIGKPFLVHQEGDTSEPLDSLVIDEIFTAGEGGVSVGQLVTSQPSEEDVADGMFNSFGFNAYLYNDGALFREGSSNIVVPTDATNPDHFGRTLGFALGNAAEGEKVQVRTHGYMLNNAWDLELDLCYAGSNGSLVHTVGDGFEWLQVIGSAVDKHTLSIHFGPSVKLG